MAVSRPTYTTRDEVKQTLDIKVTTRSDLQVDRAIQSASDEIDGQLHRVFYTTLTTRFWDWPNFQSAYPWRVWFDQAELADVTNTVPVVTTGGNTPQTIPAANILWCPANYGPPYTYMELDRSTSSSFGLGSTPQRDIHVTGAFGYQDVFAPAGALGAAMNDTTSTTAQVTNGAALGVGDVMMVDSERLLVTDKAMVSTGQTQQGAGAGTASSSDQALTVPNGALFSPQETIMLDTERMLIVDIAGNVLSVIRAWDGTTLATHSGATVYALRQLTVTRGALGSTAATHLNAAPASIAVVPPLVKELALAQACVELIQGRAGWPRTMTRMGSGSSGASANASMLQPSNLDELWQRTLARYGRKARSRSV